MVTDDTFFALPTTTGRAHREMIIPTKIGGREGTALAAEFI